MSLGINEIRNRFGFHKGTDITVPMHRTVRENFKVLSQILDEILPEGRAKATAFTRLEDASMWSNKAVAELAPVINETENDVNTDNPAETPATPAPQPTPPSVPEPIEEPTDPTPVPEPTPTPTPETPIEEVADGDEPPYGSVPAPVITAPDPSPVAEPTPTPTPETPIDTVTEEQNPEADPTGTRSDDQSSGDSSE